MRRGKKYNQAVKGYNKQELFVLDKAIEMAKKFSFAGFDETIEMAIRLNIKSKHTIRDTLVLPNSFKKEKKILVFAKGEKAEEAEKAGAAFVGDLDLVEKIKGGWLGFDVAVATPDMMKDVGKLGPILGRRGLMPNPKTQTVTFDLKGAIAELKKGRVEFRADKTGVVHLPIGKVSMDENMITENANVLYEEVNKRKPVDVKGEFIRSIAVATTMGPGIKVVPKIETRE